MRGKYVITFMEKYSDSTRSSSSSFLHSCYMQRRHSSCTQKKTGLMPFSSQNLIFLFPTSFFPLLPRNTSGKPPNSVQIRYEQCYNIFTIACFILGKNLSPLTDVSSRCVHLFWYENSAWFCVVAVVDVLLLFIFRPNINIFFSRAF